MLYLIAMCTKDFVLPPLPRVIDYLFIYLLFFCCCCCFKNGLSLDDNTLKEAVELFNESKHLLSANLSAIGNGTVSS